MADLMPAPTATAHTCDIQLLSLPAFPAFGHVPLLRAPAKVQVVAAVNCQLLLLYGMGADLYFADRSQYTD